MNCILIDPNVNLLAAVLKRKDVHVEVLVSKETWNPAVMGMLAANPGRVGRIYDMYPKSHTAFAKNVESDYDLTADDIRACRDAQLKVTRFMGRHILDLNEIDYRYMRALRFWTGVFSHGNIDLVFSNRIEHGDLNDAIIYELAFKRGIPVYMLAVEYANAQYMAYALKRLGRKGLSVCDVMPVMGDNYRVDALKYMHDRGCANRNVFDYFRKAQKADLKIGKNFLKAAVREVFASFRRSVEEGFRRDTENYDCWDIRTPIKVFGEWLYVRQLANAYRALSRLPDYAEKYVYYSLHLEPEATILNRGSFSNQLQVVEMLSRAAPSGWKVFVKEHPMQFSIADPSRKGFFFFSNNISYYRSKQFYAQLLRMPNIVLIRPEVDSRELIEHAQAVSTISGTVCLEAVAQKKPLIVFSAECNCVAGLAEVFRISSGLDVKSAMAKIARGFSPRYEDLADRISKSIIEEKDYTSADSIVDKQFLFGKILDYVLTLPEAMQ